MDRLLGLVKGQIEQQTQVSLHLDFMQSHLKEICDLDSIAGMGPNTANASHELSMNTCLASTERLVPRIPVLGVVRDNLFLLSAYTS